MQRKLEIRLAEGKSATIDMKKSSVADFASLFIDDAVERVRGAAAAQRVTNVEMLAEAFLDILNQRLTYFLAHVEAGERDALLEWLTSAIVGGYGQDFLGRYLKLLAQGQGPGEGGSADR